MRAPFRMATVIATVALAGCPDEQPPKPRPTMPDGPLPFPLPELTEGPTLALAAELVLFDHTILRKPTSSANTYAGEPTPYVRPTSLTPVAVSARADEGAGQIALFVNAQSSAIETLTLLDELKMSSVAIAVNVTNQHRGQLPYLFGAADPTVRDRLHIEVTGHEIVIGDETVEDPFTSAIHEAVAVRRGQSTVGVEVRVGIRPGTTNQRLVSVLDALAHAKVEAVHVVPIQSSVAHSSSGYQRRGAVPSVRIGQPSAQGDLDKAIIRRYIKRNIQKIEYCYEKELLGAPDLAGTVTTQFFIAPTGTVATATAAGVSPSVAQCIGDVIKRIEFPKPRGGGGVQVNYPFTLRPYGG